MERNQRAKAKPGMPVREDASWARLGAGNLPRLRALCWEALWPHLCVAGKHTQHKRTSQCRPRTVPGELPGPPPRRPQPPWLLSTPGSSPQTESVNKDPCLGLLPGYRSAPVMLRHKHKELSGSTCSLLNQDLEGRRPNPESEALGGPSSQGAVAGGCRGVFWFGGFFNFTCHPSGVRGHHFPSPRTGRHSEALLARGSSPGADMHKLPRVSLDCGYQFEFNKHSTCGR